MTVVVVIRAQCLITVWYKCVTPNFVVITILVFIYKSNNKSNYIYISFYYNVYNMCVCPILLTRTNVYYYYVSATYIRLNNTR